MRIQTSNILAWLAVSAVVFTLGACGGGGGDSTSPAPSATKAEGVYSGTLTGSTSSAFKLLVLENDEYWGVYGADSASAFLVAGFIQGQGTSNNGSFTSSNLKDFGTAPPASGTLTATYVVNTSISGTAVAPAGTVTFSGTPITSSTYNYNAPADLANIAGTWSLTALDLSNVALTVATTGAFTGSSGGCSFTGTFTPRTSGKNVFNFTLTFGAAPCALPNQTGTGIALSYLLSNGTTRQLIVVGTNAERTSGTMLIGTR